MVVYIVIIRFMLATISKNTHYFLLKQVSFKCSSLLHSQRQKMEYDVVIVGGGVAGLSTAIKLKQKQTQSGRPISVCVLEKGSEIGDHVLSGNCFQPRGFDELFPGWRQWTQNKPPIQTQVTSDNFYVLSQNKSIKVPHFLFPKTINNQGNYIISLGHLSKWMGQKASEMGVDVFTGTPANQLLYNKDGSVKGVATQDFGISKSGQPKDSFMRGIEIIGKQTVFAEGCRGSLTEKIIQKYKLRQQSDPQSYGIGLKEVWEVEEGNKLFQPGYVQHTVGWPVDMNTYAGSFMYHMKPNIIHFGYVVGLNYKNPYISPYQQFQRLKTHPVIKRFLEGGQCISYGARALNSGGYFAIPKLVFPGGLLVGCSAGFMNVLKIKGSHTAIKSGIEAGNTIFQKLTDPGNLQSNQSLKLDQYQKKMKQSWVWQQLRAARNFKGSFKNLYTGLAYGGFYKLFQGKQPFDLRNKNKDSTKTQPAQNYKPIQYPKHDRKLTFDLLDNLGRSGTNHDHDQPSHLVVKSQKAESPLKSLNKYSAPQQRFCPAKVYQFVQNEKGEKKLQINAQNCLHCKTCSIKMVDEYIQWKTPQGNGGPKYNLM